MDLLTSKASVESMRIAAFLNFVLKIIRQKFQYPMECDL
jgi:hypothetical protein